ncbi:MAG: alpha-L-fucosidase [Bacteroidetes bacterium]|nr:MAG: alpha-L-fucosidase [Bacteroidota bacterium]
MKKGFLSPLFLLLLCFPGLSLAQTDNIHGTSSTYQVPSDPLVQAKLETWQDLKFGIIIHWGVYAVPGMIESWALCSEDWITRPEGMSYSDFKRWYWNLSNIFNPVNFNPERWARVSREAGMKYLVFTTKHHDGFAMFDTRQSDYKITAGPFRHHPKANVAYHVFEAYRQEGLMIGAYFSKPDWHSQDFWWDKYATPNRNPNYNILKYPEKWKAFQDFTFAQIQELMQDYGAIDILWLDGGWIRPKHTVNDEVRAWGAPIPDWSQEIDMPAIAEMGRKAQPGLIIADRTVHGPYENYLTPERRIPDTKLDHPWESCLPLGNNWGYVPNDPLKSPTTVIHTLVEVVAKGGNLLLGIGPQSDGTFPLEVEQRLQAIGAWLETNGEALYGTRAVDRYQDGQTFFTGKGETTYATHLLPEGEAVPRDIRWAGHLPGRGQQITCLETGKSVKWRIEGEQLVVEVPKSLVGQERPAVAFALAPMQ